MRTTLTLDDDVSAKVTDEARRSGRPFKQVVNELLRLALTVRRDPARARPFKVRPQPLGLRPGLEYDNVGELLEQLEGLAHR